MNDRKKTSNHPHRTNKLIHLVRMYLTKKHIQMKPIMKMIYDHLMNDQPISQRQLEVIIPYLLNDLKNYTTEQIIDEFSVCLYNSSSISDEDYLSKYYPYIIGEYLKKSETNNLEQIFA